MLTRELEETLSYAVDEAVRHKHEYVTLEHLLFALLEDVSARDILFNCGADLEELGRALQQYFEEQLEKIPPTAKHMPELTPTFQSTISYAVLQAEGSGQGGGRREYFGLNVSGGAILCRLSSAPAGCHTARYFELYFPRHLKDRPRRYAARRHR